MSRECGSCTKCCEGHLVGQIRDQLISPGNPCFFVNIGFGCKDYDNRPDEPCKTFSCYWKSNKDVPNRFKPDKINAVFVERFVKGQNGQIGYIDLIKAPSDPSEEVLSWFLEYAKEKELNAALGDNKERKYLGTAEFVDAMNKEYNSG